MVLQAFSSGVAASNWLNVRSNLPNDHDAYVDMQEGEYMIARVISELTTTVPPEED